MSREILKNVDHKFIVFQRWQPNGHDFMKPADDYDGGYDDSYDDDKPSIPDPVKSSYQIQQKIVQQFSEQYNFWDVFTKFPLTAQFLEKLAKVPGIEIIAQQCTTPYRTRIAIGMLFVDREVIKNINELAENYVNENDCIYGVLINSSPTPNFEEIIDNEQDS